MNSEQEIRSDERTKVGRLLHDVISNELLNIQFLIIQSEEKFPKENFIKINRELEFVRNQVRAMSHGLIAPRILKSKSFIEHIKEILLDYTFLFPDLNIDFLFYPRIFEFNFNDQFLEEILIVIKEVIQNAIQHGQPKELEVSITDFEDAISIQITDDGKGFNSIDKATGVGLINCQERIRNINGTFSIESEPNQGTTIHIEILK